MNLADFNAWHVAPSLGHIVERWQPQFDAPKGAVIYLQDLHVHPEAQKHLAELIGQAHEQLGSARVAVEGAAGALPVELFTWLPDSSLLDALALNLRDNGWLTGAEYQAITDPNTLDLWGIDETTRFNQHLEAYKAILGVRDLDKPRITRLYERLLAARAGVFPKDYEQLSQLRRRHQDGESGAFFAYARALMRSAAQLKLELDSWPHVKTLQAALQLQKGIDLRRLFSDAANLEKKVQPLAKTGDQPLLDSLQPAEGNAQPALPGQEACKRLTALAAANGIPVPGSVQAYLDYVAKLESAQSQQLLEEMDSLYQALGRQLLLDEGQRNFADVLGRLELFNRLIRLQFSPAEYQHYRTQSLNLPAADLWNRLKQVVNDTLLAMDEKQWRDFIGRLPIYERFYQLAQARDDIIAGNILGQLKQNTDRPLIVITGGFHTPGVTRRLRQANVAYLVVVPAVTSPADDSRYQQRMTQAVPSAAQLLKDVRQQSLAPPSEVAQTPASSRLFASIFFAFAALLAQKYPSTQKPNWIERIQQAILQHPDKATALRAGIHVDPQTGRVTLTALGEETELDSLTLPLAPSRAIEPPLRSVPLKSMPVPMSETGMVREPSNTEQIFHDPRDPAERQRQRQVWEANIQRELENPQAKRRHLVSPAARRIVRGKMLAKGAHILSLGAGPGYDEIYLAKQGYQVTATDFAAAGLNHINTLAAEANVASRVAVQVQDLFEPLTAADSSFDMILAHLSLHYLDDETLRARVQDMFRILRPGGKVMIVVRSTDDSKFQEESLHLKAVLSGGHWAISRRGGAQQRFFTRDELQSFFQSFQKVDIRSSQYQRFISEPLSQVFQLVAEKPAALSPESGMARQQPEKSEPSPLSRGEDNRQWKIERFINHRDGALLTASVRSGSGMPVLIVPGWAGELSFEKQRDSLLMSPQRPLILLNRRSYDPTGPPQRMVSTDPIGEAASDLDTALKHFGKRVMLAPHSAGGLVTLRFAANPAFEKEQKLVVGTSFSNAFFPSELPATLSDFIETVIPAPFDFILARSGWHHDRKTAERVVRILKPASYLPTPLIVAALTGGPLPALGLFRRFKTPMDPELEHMLFEYLKHRDAPSLIADLKAIIEEPVETEDRAIAGMRESGWDLQLLGSEGDPLVPPESVERIAKKLGLKSTQVAIMRGASGWMAHAPMMDERVRAAWEARNEAFYAMLNGQPAAERDVGMTPPTAQEGEQGAVEGERSRRQSLTSVLGFLWLLSPGVAYPLVRAGLPAAATSPAMRANWQTMVTLLRQYVRTPELAEVLRNDDPVAYLRIASIPDELNGMTMPARLRFGTSEASHYLVPMHEALLENPADLLTTTVHELWHVADLSAHHGRPGRSLDGELVAYTRTVEVIERLIEDQSFIHAYPDLREQLIASLPGLRGAADHAHWLYQRLQDAQQALAYLKTSTTKNREDRDAAIERLHRAMEDLRISRYPAVDGRVQDLEAEIERLGNGLAARVASREGMVSGDVNEVRAAVNDGTDVWADPMVAKAVQAAMKAHAATGAPPNGTILELSASGPIVHLESVARSNELGGGVIVLEPIPGAFVVNSLEGGQLVGVWRRGTGKLVERPTLIEIRASGTRDEIVQLVMRFRIRLNEPLPKDGAPRWRDLGPTTRVALVYDARTQRATYSVVDHEGGMARDGEPESPDVEFTSTWILTTPELSDAHRETLWRVLGHYLEAHYLLKRGQAVDPEKIFGNGHPLHLEVGYGRGYQLLKDARANPDVNYLGIDSRGPVPQSGWNAFIELVSREIRRPNNVRILQSDIDEALRTSIRPASISHIGIYFPTPHTTEMLEALVSKPLFPRDVKESKRLARQLFDVLRPGGVIEIVSDDENYAQLLRDVFVQAGGGAVAVELTDQIPENLPNRYLGFSTLKLPHRPLSFEGEPLTPVSKPDVAKRYIRVVKSMAPDSLVIPPTSIEEADAILTRLGVHPGSRVVSIGPGFPFRIGSGHAQDEAHGRIPWEWLAVKRGATVTVFEPVNPEHRAWEDTRRTWVAQGMTGQLQVMPEGIGFEQSELSPGSVQMAMMFAVLSDSASTITTQTKRSILDETVRVLEPGGFLLVGWYNYGRDPDLAQKEAQATWENLRYLEEQGVQLTPIEQGVEPRLFGNRNWVIFQVARVRGKPGEAGAARQPGDAERGAAMVGEAVDEAAFERLRQAQSPNLRLALGRSLGAEPRPTEAKLLDIAHVGYLQEVRRQANPAGALTRWVYGGSGADISTFLLTTNVQEGFMLDATRVSVSALAAALARWDQDDDKVAEYFRLKFVNGFGSIAYLSNEKLPTYLIQELRAIGVRRETVRIAEYPGHTDVAVLTFEWAPYGTPLVTRRLVFIPQIMQKMSQRGGIHPVLEEALRKGIHGYYQRASQLLPRAFASYLPTVAGAIAPEGAVVIDTTATGYQPSKRKSRFEPPAHFDPISHLNDTGRAWHPLPPNPRRRAWASVLPSEADPIGYGWRLRVFVGSERGRGAGSKHNEAGMARGGRRDPRKIFGGSRLSLDQLYESLRYLATTYAVKRIRLYGPDGKLYGGVRVDRSIEQGIEQAINNLERLINRVRATEALTESIRYSYTYDSYHPFWVKVVFSTGEAGAARQPGKEDEHGAAAGEKGLSASPALGPTSRAARLDDKESPVQGAIRSIFEELQRPLDQGSFRESFRLDDDDPMRLGNIEADHVAEIPVESQQNLFGAPSMTEGLLIARPFQSNFTSAFYRDTSNAQFIDEVSRDALIGKHAHALVRGEDSAGLFAQAAGELQGRNDVGPRDAWVLPGNILQRVPDSQQTENIGYRNPRATYTGPTETHIGVGRDSTHRDIKDTMPPPGQQAQTLAPPSLGERGAVTPEGSSKRRTPVRGIPPAEFEALWTTLHDTVKPVKQGGGDYSLKEVAQASGISRSAVSNVLRRRGSVMPETRDAILRGIEMVRTRPSQKKVQRRYLGLPAPPDVVGTFRARLERAENQYGLRGIATEADVDIASVISARDGTNTPRVGMVHLITEAIDRLDARHETTVKRIKGALARYGPDPELQRRLEQAITAGETDQSIAKELNVRPARVKGVREGTVRPVVLNQQRFHRALDRLEVRRLAAEMEPANAAAFAAVARAVLEENRYRAAHRLPEYQLPTAAQQNLAHLLTLRHGLEPGMQGVAGELPPGEGKTLAMVMAAYAETQRGHRVHIADFNSYLAYTSAEAMAPILGALGVTVGLVVFDQFYALWDRTRGQWRIVPMAERQKVLGAQVVYAGYQDLVAEFLLAQAERELAAQRPTAEPDGEQHAFSLAGVRAYINEIDAVLEDDAVTPFELSGPTARSGRDRTLDRDVFQRMRESTGMHAAQWLERFHQPDAHEYITRALEPLNHAHTPQDMARLRQLAHAALVAQSLIRDVDYRVRTQKQRSIQNRRLYLLRDATGRWSSTLHYSPDIEAMLQVKEGLPPAENTSLLGVSSYLSFFEQYGEGFTGTSGTLRDVRQTMGQEAKLQVYVLNGNRPSRRAIYPPVYRRTLLERDRAALVDIVQAVAEGRPVVVIAETPQEIEQMTVRLDALLHGTHGSPDSAEQAFLQELRHTPQVAAALVAIRDSRIVGEPMKVTGDAESFHELREEAALLRHAGWVEEGRDRGLRVPILLATRAVARGTDIRANPQAASRGGAHLVLIGGQRRQRDTVHLLSRVGRFGDPGTSQQFLSLDDIWIRSRKPDTDASDVQLPEAVNDLLRQVEQELRHARRERVERVRLREAFAQLLLRYTAGQPAKRAMRFINEWPERPLVTALTGQYPEFAEALAREFEGPRQPERLLRRAVATRYLEFIDYYQLEGRGADRQPEALYLDLYFLAADVINRASAHGHSEAPAAPLEGGAQENGYAQADRGAVTPKPGAPPVFQSLQEMSERLPSLIIQELNSFSLSSEAQAQAEQLIALMERLYAQMGLITQHYHNHAHNLWVTYAALALGRYSGRIRTVRDAKLVFLGALWHDFHLRQATLQSDGQTRGTPPLVEETLRQLADVLGMLSTTGPPQEPQYAVLMNPFRKLFLQITRQLLPGKSFVDTITEAQAIVAGTDFPSNVGPVPASMRAAAAYIRTLIGEWAAGRRTLKETQETIGAAASLLNEQRAGWTTEQARSAERVLGIETVYFQTLQRVAKRRRITVHELAQLVERAADQAGSAWLASPEMYEQEIIPALQTELPVSARETYLSFMEPRHLVPETLRWLRPLPEPSRRNFVTVVERFASLGGAAALDDWRLAKPAVLRSLALSGNEEPGAARPPDDGQRHTARQLRDWITPEVAKHLEADPYARLVFLRRLSETEGQVGALRVLDAAQVATLGGQARLDAATGFFVGSPTRAAELASSGVPLFAAVTEQGWNTPTTVANGRSAFLPLPDGSFLAIKGSGQYRDLQKPPQYPGRGYHYGLTTATERARTIRAATELKDLDPYLNQVAAIRPLPLAVGQDGALVSTAGFAHPDFPDRPLDPALFFIHVRELHRFSELPFLFRMDPGIKRSLARLTRTLRNLGEWTLDRDMTVGEWLNYAAEQFGRTEAKKQNAGWAKMTIHSQDFTLAGEENDPDEWQPLDEYIAHVKRERDFEQTADHDLLVIERLDMAGVIAKISALADALLQVRDAGQPGSAVPDRLAPLRTFAHAYFRTLNEKHLLLWADAERWDGLSRPARILNYQLRAGDLPLQMMAWAQEEGTARGLRPSSRNPSAPQPLTDRGAARQAIEGFAEIRTRLAAMGIASDELDRLKDALVQAGVTRVTGIRNWQESPQKPAAQQWNLLGPALVDVIHAKQGPLTLKITPKQPILEHFNAFGVDIESYQAMLRRAVAPPHAAVQPIYGFGLTEHLAWWLQPWVEGETLAHWVERSAEPLKPDELRAVVHDLRDGIDALRKQGLRHGDLTLANVVLRRDAGGRIVGATVIDLSFLVEAKPLTGLDAANLVDLFLALLVPDEGRPSLDEMEPHKTVNWHVKAIAQKYRVSRRILRTSVEQLVMRGVLREELSAAQRSSWPAYASEGEIIQDVEALLGVLGSAGKDGGTARQASQTGRATVAAPLETFEVVVDGQRQTLEVEDEKTGTPLNSWVLRAMPDTGWRADKLAEEFDVEGSIAYTVWVRETGKLVAYILGRPSQGNSKELFLVAIAVQPEYQRHGIGPRLGARLIQAAHAKGFTRLVSRALATHGRISGVDRILASIGGPASVRILTLSPERHPYSPAERQRIADLNAQLAVLDNLPLAEKQAHLSDFLARYPSANIEVRLDLTGRETGAARHPADGKRGEVSNKDIKQLVKYLTENDALPAEPVDLILLLGNDDLTTFEEAANLYKAGRANRILISGGRGRLFNALLAKVQALDIIPSNPDTISEAELIKQVMIARYDIPEGAIQLETASSVTSGDPLRGNIDNSWRLLEQERAVGGKTVESVILIQTALQMRRSAAGFRHIFPAHVKLYRHAPAMSDLTALSRTEQVTLIAAALGEFDRLIDYPKRGWIASVSIPKDVRVAAKRLREASAARPPDEGQRSATAEAERRFFVGRAADFTNMTPQRFIAVFSQWLLEHRGTKVLPQKDQRDIVRFAELLTPRQSPPVPSILSATTLGMLRAGVEGAGLQFACTACAPEVHRILTAQEVPNRLVARSRKMPEQRDDLLALGHVYVLASVAGESVIVDVVADQFEVDAANNMPNLGIVVIPQALVESPAYRGQFPMYAVWAPINATPFASRILHALRDGDVDRALEEFKAEAAKRPREIAGEYESLAEVLQAGSEVVSMEDPAARAFIEGAATVLPGGGELGAARRPEEGKGAAPKEDNGFVLRKQDQSADEVDPLLEEIFSAEEARQSR